MNAVELELGPASLLEYLAADIPLDSRSTKISLFPHHAQLL